MTEPAPRKSDLGIRVVSAVAMVAVAGAALWFRGYAWTAFVVAIGLGVFWEWSQLCTRFARTPITRAIWLIGGAIYIGLAAGMLIYMNSTRFAERSTVLLPICAVIATDIGAYFAGRTFGGPKIAPKISPSKTWAGLFGGALGASAVIMLIGGGHDSGDIPSLWAAALAVMAGVLLAIVAQTGDFFESWMKRRAGVKDSGNVLPGHGGLFDRVDGLVAVMAVGGFLLIADSLFSGLP